jgi:hypothetical protein
VPLFVIENGVDVASGKKLGGSWGVSENAPLTDFERLFTVESANGRWPKQVTDPEILPELPVHLSLNPLGNAETSPVHTELFPGLSILPLSPKLALTA